MTTTPDHALAGIGVSSGVATGPVARLAEPVALPPDTGAEADVDAAAARAVAALETVAADLDGRAARAAGTAAEVLLTQAMMARDPALADGVRRHLAEGRSAPHAIDGALAGFRTALEAAGGYLAERASDLNDLRDRALAALLDRPMPGVPDPGQQFVLVAGDLAPADTATLDPEIVRGIVTERGGPTGHTAILAKSLGIPAVVACPGAAELSDGDPVLVDGDGATVTVRPDPAEVRRLTAHAEAVRAAAAGSGGPGRTADGTSVALLVNVGAQAELDTAASGDSEGVGLLRTEFLYLDRESEPTHDEQRAAYRSVFEAFAGRKVVVRTLDIGADKPVPFVDNGDEANPALGVRGLRLARRDAGLLTRQLAAIAEAAEPTSAMVWVMAPMVATAAEAAEFAARAHEHGLPVAGSMIEVPGAALRAHDVLAECDFASLGTNDLSQYALAADRTAGQLADLLDPWQPALLDLVAHTAEAGSASGKPVGVCGEAAGDPLLAPVLVGLGVTSLSMAPNAVGLVRATLARHTLDECRELARLARTSTTAEAARAAVTAAAHPLVPG